MQDPKPKAGDTAKRAEKKEGQIIPETPHEQISGKGRIAVDVFLFFAPWAPRTYVALSAQDDP